MMQQFLKWLGTRLFPNEAPPKPAPQPVGVRVRPPAERSRAARRVAEPPAVDFSPQVDGTVVENGPGKNVLVRNRFVREDTGTHETLKILDVSVDEAQEEVGIDPYNTGRFDRAKHWDTRFRK
jgi:hypothetical protein